MTCSLPPLTLSSPGYLRVIELVTSLGVPGGVTRPGQRPLQVLSQCHFPGGRLRWRGRLYLTYEVDDWLDDLAATDIGSCRQAVLVGGDASGNGTRWYRTASPKPERLTEEYLAEPATEEEA